MAQQTQSAGGYVEYGTVRPCLNFNADEMAKALRNAVKGVGTDEAVIVNVLGTTTNHQRQEIKIAYKQQFGRDLEDDLKSDLSGHFEDVARALLMEPRAYDAYCLHKAMSGLGTKESVLTEILVTRSNEEITHIKQIYKAKYRQELERDIKGDTSGHFEKLLVSLANAARDEGNLVDVNKAHHDAQLLKDAGVKQWGTDEETFNLVMATRSHAHLCAVFEHYERIAREDIVKSIRSEFSGDIEDAMVAIVEVVRGRAEYFAKKLYKSMKGLGTKDQDLIRIIVSRSEVDLGNIKVAFRGNYNADLADFIKDDTSGDYCKMLLKIVN